MSSKAEATAMKQDGKRALTPKLRFPEFRDAAEWKAEPLEAVSVPVMTDRARQQTDVL